MLVMPEIEDPFVPLGSDGLFVDPYEARLVFLSIFFGIDFLILSGLSSLSC